MWYAKDAETRWFCVSLSRKLNPNRLLSSQSCVQKISLMHQTAFVLHIVPILSRHLLTNLNRNINVFGLAFTISVSGFIILLDLVLLRFLDVFFRYLRKRPTPRLERWTQEGVYQLQRRAYEAHGYGDWGNLMEEIPVTTEKTNLPDLPVDIISDATGFEFERNPGKLSPPARTSKSSDHNPLSEKKV